MVGPGIHNDETAVGDDFELSFLFPIDLTGFTGWAGKARPKDGPNDGSADVAFTVDVTGQASGRIIYVLPSAITTALGPITIQYDLRVKKPNGHRVTWLSGWVDLGQPVTGVPA